MRLFFSRGFLLCIGLLVVSGCDGDRRREADVTTTPPPVTMQNPPMSLPIRRCPDVMAPSSLGQREPQRADDVLVRSSQVDDDVQLVVHGGSAQTLGNCSWLREKLGFTAAVGSGGLMRRRVSGREKTNFAKALAELLAQAQVQFKQAQDRLAAVGEPGLLPGRSPGAGVLIYTGHPLDLAMPDAGRGTTYFLPVCLRNGERAFTRGGRLFVDDDGRLALREGVISEQQMVVPPEARAVRLLPSGEVEALLPVGVPKVLGRLALVVLEKPEGNGRIFKGTPGAPLFAGEGEVPPFKPGHLEYPCVNVKADLADLAQNEFNVRLLQRIELGLAEPFRQTLVNMPVQPLQPVEPTQDRPARFPLLIGADVPLASAQLKALGVQVETAPGRTLIPVGDREESRVQLVNALTKVLQGLRKRMDIAQLNYRNANRLRDEQGQLNPFRRKLIRVGPEGELLEAEDETPFRKELSPNHPDAGPDGTVLFPNVNRMVEKADFDQAAGEYRLIRTAIERLAPGFIFPDPPVLQLEPKAP